MAWYWRHTGVIIAWYWRYTGALLAWYWRDTGVIMVIVNMQSPAGKETIINRLIIIILSYVY